MIDVYVGARETLQSVLDVRQVAVKDKPVPLAQETLLGVECTVEAEASVGKFTSCLPHFNHFLPTALNVNPTAPGQLEVYAQIGKSMREHRKVLEEEKNCRKNRERLDWKKRWPPRNTSKCVE